MSAPGLTHPPDLGPQPGQTARSAPQPRTGEHVLRDRDDRRGAGLPAWRAIAAVVAVVALAGAVDPWGLRSFTSLRWAVVSTAIGVALLSTRTVNLPRRSTVAWMALIGAMIVAAATGLDPVTAWLGHPQRHLGVLAWVTFGAAAAAGSGIASDERAQRAVQTAAVVGGVVVGGSALVDALGWDPLSTSFADGRVGGLFGQPIVLATVSLLLLPLVVTASRFGIVRWFVAGSLGAAIVVSQSRGALVGLVALAAVTVPAYVRTRPRNRHHRVEVGGEKGESGRDPRARRPVRVVLTLVGAGAVLAATVLFTPFGERVRDMPASSRVDEWQLAMQVAATDPIGGTGPEGYRIAVLGELDHDYVETYDRDVIIDRAHSSPLDVAVAGGGLAAGAYIVLLGGVGIAVWQLHRSRPRSVPAAAGAGAVAVLAAGLVAFPVPEVDAVAWLFAGLAVGAARSLTSTDSESKPSRRRYGLMVAGGVLTAVALTAGVTDVMVDHRLDNALAASRTGQHDEALKHAAAAVDLRGDQLDTFYVAAQVAAAGPTILDLDAGITWTERGLDRFPDDPALRDLQVELLVERALRSELQADVDAAASAIGDLRSDDPTSIIAESGTQALTRACLYRCDNKP